MNCSLEPNNSADFAPFAEAAGVRTPNVPPTDPILAWVDLMDVVEALCPVWPPHTTTSGNRFLL